MAKSARTQVEQVFDPDAVRKLKADATHDIDIAGPEIAASAIRAGLVDEFQLIVCPVLVGDGKRFFPTQVRLDLELVGERRLPTAWSSCGTPLAADRSVLFGGSCPTGSGMLRDLLNAPTTSARGRL